MNNVNRSSEGIYTCKATNEIGLSKANTNVLITGEFFIKINYE